MSKSSAYFKVNNLDEKHDVKKLKRELDGLSGVISVSVSDKSGCVAVDYDTTGVNQEQLSAKIQKLGYDIAQSQQDPHIM